MKALKESMEAPPQEGKNAAQNEVRKFFINGMRKVSERPISSSEIWKTNQSKTELEGKVKDVMNLVLTKKFLP